MAFSKKLEGRNRKFKYPIRVFFFFPFSISPYKSQIGVKMSFSLNQLYRLCAHSQTNNSKINKISPKISINNSTQKLIIFKRLPIYKYYNTSCVIQSFKECYAKLSKYQILGLIIANPFLSKVPRNSSSSSSSSSFLQNPSHQL